MPRARITLDNSAFAGRLKTTYRRRSTYERRTVLSGGRLINDIQAAKPVQLKPIAQKPKSTVHRTAPKSVPSRQTRSNVLKRQLVSRTYTKRRRHWNIKSLALASMAVVLFVFGVGVGIAQLNTNHKVKAQVKTLAAQTDGGGNGALSDGGLPSEEKPGGDIGSYRVSPLSPRVITISGLGVEARVLTLGVKPNNELKTPASIYDAGWYEGSAKPGENGAVLINGHVHGPSLPGVFVGLKKLQPGDKISIERGDGKKFNYHVAEVKSYDKDNVDMGAAFNSAEPGKPGLNLITCDGAYNDSGEYEKRLIVFAVQD